MAIFNALLNLRELKELYSGKPVCVCPLYKGVINAPKTFKTTGNPIILPEYKSLVKLNVEFLPIQAGTGDPSPDNVRPISGYDNVQVTRCGKNLCKFGSITFTGVLQGPASRLDGVFPPGKYTFSADITSLENESGECLAILYNVSQKSRAGDIMHLDPNQGRVSHVTSATKEFDAIYLYSDNGFAESTGKTATYSDIQLEFGSTPTPYEPYQPGTTATLTLPETIYGGTVDAVTGVGEKTWGYIASYNGESLPGEWISDRDVYSAGTTPTTGAQVAYKLAAPEPFSVSQISIPSLGSENTFFTNGENLDIIYKKEFFWGDEA